MSAAEVVERAEYSEDDSLGEDAGCNAFKSHGVTDMGSSNLLAEIHTESRCNLVCDEVPHDAQALLLVGLRSDSCALLEVEQDMLDFEGVSPKRSWELLFDPQKPCLGS